MINSKNYFDLLKSVTPNGCQTLSKMPNRFINGIYPKVLERGKHGHVTDVDGNTFIDLISGLGAISVGYADDRVNDAAIMQMLKGTSFSLPTTLEYLVAKKLTELVPWTEQWKFGKNGTDGTVMAVRAARAYTGRTKILTVGYNGCADQFEIKGTRNAGIPKELEETIDKATYNNFDSFNCLLSNEYACVLMEPMVYEYPNQGFLEQVRELCSQAGTILIFDEVVTGGRFNGFTAGSYFKVQPDIIVLSKGIANGFPLCAVGSTKSFMETFERNDFFASGTFGGECVSLAACLATIPILRESTEEMTQKGYRIKEAFNKLFNSYGAFCKGHPTRFIFEFPITAHKALFMQEMCLQGVLIGAANMIMASHTHEDVTQIINAIFKSYKVLKDNWNSPLLALKGDLPTDALRVGK